MTGEDTITAVSPASTFVALFPTPTTEATGTWDKTKVPFARQLQLCDTLNYSLVPEKSSQQLRSHGHSQTLPDAPRIRLDSRSKILEYCLKDLDVPRLNKFGEKLWWAGPSPEIESLTQHTVLDRRIQVTEDPAHQARSRRSLDRPSALPQRECAFQSPPANTRGHSLSSW